MSPKLGAAIFFGKSLVVAQISASLVLMIGAGLFVRTLQNIQNKNLGIQSEQPASASVLIPPAMAITPSGW